MGWALKEVSRKQGAPEKRVAGEVTWPSTPMSPCDHDLGQSCSLLSSQRAQGDPWIFLPASARSGVHLHNPVFSLCWLCCCHSNQHTGQVYLTPARQSPVMALCGLKTMKCFLNCFLPAWPRCMGQAILEGARETQSCTPW